MQSRDAIVQARPARWAGGGRGRPLPKVQGLRCVATQVGMQLSSKVQGSWVVELCHWPTAVEAQKYGGCMLSGRADLPRSDNVVGLLRSGPAWSGHLRFGSTGGGPRKLNNFGIRPSRRGRGDGDHPSFPIQALHPQLNKKVRASHLPEPGPQPTPLKAHPSRHDLHVGLPVLHFAVHFTRNN